MTRIEQASSNDLQSILELASCIVTATKSADVYKRAIDDGECFIARSGDRPVGFVIKNRALFDRDFIAFIAVHPDFRSHGIAVSLMRHVESTMSGRLFTSTNQSNDAMRRLLEKLGYERCGIIEQIDEGDPELIYCKNAI